MKQHLQILFDHALTSLQQAGIIPDELPDFTIERTRDPKYGDFACNLAMVLAKPCRRKPRDIAADIMAHLPADTRVSQVEIAGPGFINLFLSPQVYHAMLLDILTSAENYGKSTLGKEQSVMVEFVSANPTGPLHVGHGRGASYGASLATLLSVAGYQVHREYYINDAGRQMNILTVSVWLRYLELFGETLTFPTNAYRGDYIRNIGQNLKEKYGTDLYQTTDQVFTDLPADEPEGGDKERYIDALIERCRNLIGESAYQQVFHLAVDTILVDIREDLAGFGVEFEEWFSELSLEPHIPAVIDTLRDAGHVYEKEGNWWFRSTNFGDEKDRVVRRKNGVYTYMASDIAYHLNKLDRGFDHLINIWGADHHGYVPRVKAALTASGRDAERLNVLLVQFATLYRGQEKLPMSTRSGEFVTLRALREEVGKDAARFFYVQRRSEQHMDFDLELAKSQSNDNPVYYIQYAHARIASVFRQLEERAQPMDTSHTDFNRLAEDHEKALMVMLSRYPEVIESAATAFEPHQIAYYLRELAQAFHTYYNAHIFLVDDDALRNTRLILINAIRQVLRNGLAILGVSAPDVM